MNSHRIRTIIFTLLAVFLLLVPVMTVAATSVNQSTTVFYVA
ncbi:MAG: hypothetical protein ABIK68_00720 [bacterium]